MNKFSFALLAGCSAVLGASANFASAAPLPDAVPVEVFAAPPMIEDAQLSPDGTKIAAKLVIRGKQTLVVMPLFGGGQPAAFDAGDIDVNWWSWVNDGWLAVGFGADEMILGEEMYVTRVAGVSADMTKVNRLDWANSGVDADNLVWSARDGSARILFAKQTGFKKEEDWYPTVYEADVSTGKTRMVHGAVPGVYRWEADGSGKVRLGLHYDYVTRRYTMMYRGPQGGSFKSVPLGTGREDWKVPVPSIFRADGSAIAIDDSTGHAAVYEVSLADLSLGRKILGVDGYDVDGVIANASDNDLDGIAVTDKAYRVHWLNPALKTLQSEIDDSVGAGNGLISSWSRDRQRLLIEIGSPSQAGGLYYWDTRQGAMQLVSFNNQTLKARSLSPVRTVRYTARDGTPIEAVLTVPRGREAKNLPLIMMPHGGPHARDQEQFDWWVQYLAEQGYAVMQPNYRGSSGYGDAFAELGDGEWGLKMQDDLLDGIDWAAKQGLVDPKRVCIVGASYGGYAAMRGAQRDGKSYRCAVSFAGVSDLAAMRRYDRQFLGREASDYWKEQAPDLRSVSPRFGAQSFGAPILIIHGVKDKRVPVRQSRLLAEELKKAGRPYQYIEQPLADHHFSRAEDRLEFLKALKAFLDKHNPA